MRTAISLVFFNRCVFHTLSCLCTGWMLHTYLSGWSLRSWVWLCHWLWAKIYIEIETYVIHVIKYILKSDVLVCFLSFLMIRISYFFSIKWIAFSPARCISMCALVLMPAFGYLLIQNYFGIMKVLWVDSEVLFLWLCIRFSAGDLRYHI
jgi:hypothetical protein